MTQFHTFAISHEDILQTCLTMDVFTADLWDDYKDRGIKGIKLEGQVKWFRRCTCRQARLWL